MWLFDQLMNCRNGAIKPCGPITADLYPGDLRILQCLLTTNEKLLPLYFIGEVSLPVIDPWHIHIQQQRQIVSLLGRCSLNPIRAGTKKHSAPYRRQQQIRIADQHPICSIRHHVFRGNLSPRNSMNIFRITSSAQITCKPMSEYNFV